MHIIKVVDVMIVENLMLLEFLIVGKRENWKLVEIELAELVLLELVEIELLEEEELEVFELLELDTSSSCLPIIYMEKVTAPPLALNVILWLVAVTSSPASAGAVFTRAD